MHAKKMEAPCKTRDMPWFEDDAPESASLTSGLSLDQMLSKMEPVSAESSSTSDAMVSALFFFADVFSSTLTTAYMVFPFVVNVMTRKLTSLEMSTICRAMKMAAIRSSLYDEWLDAGMAIDWHDFAVNMLLVRLKRGEYRRFGLKL